MHRPWHWIPRASSLALLLAVPLSAHAIADGPRNGPSVLVDAESVDAGDEELYLAVSLNQADTDHLARFVLRDGALFASAATLQALGLRWPGSEQASGLVALAVLPGLVAHYDAARQRVALNAPVSMLSHAPVRGGFIAREAPRTDQAEPVGGAILNYSLYGVRSGNQAASLSGSGELRVFGAGPGTWRSSLRGRVAEGRHEATRLDTAWTLDLPDRMLSLTIGDTITGATLWSRPLRIGGIRLARNFELQPYRISTPLATFAGEAALPSTVDLFVDGLRQSSLDVPPGQFVFASAPTLDGAGNAQLVITDINGQRRVVEFAFYGTPQLLARGMSDWSVELGTVRHRYGGTSFDYASQPMASASIRHGAGDSTTVAAHVEANDQVQIAGAGVTTLLGNRGGLLSAALVASRSSGALAGDDGLQRIVAYQWSTRGFNFNITSTRSDDGFRDLASLEGAPVARGTDQVHAGLWGLGGQWGLGWFRRIERDGNRNGFASLSWSRRSPRAGYFSAQLNRRIGGSGLEASLTWTLPLAQRDAIAVRTQRTSDGDLHAVAELSRQLPASGEGWGWRAQAGDQTGVQVQAMRMGRHGEWTVGMNQPRGDAGTTMFGSVDGGLALLRGRVFAMRRIDEAFALVSTAGVPGVPVRLSNNVVGRTDANGMLMVGRLTPWQDNRLSIDPLSLPADVWIGSVEKIAVPSGHTGVLVDFEMRPTLVVQAQVLDADGAPLPAGSPVWLSPADPSNDAPLTVVGQDSQLYLRDPAPHARLRIGHGGDYCEIVLPEVAQASGYADLEPIRCR